MKKFIEEKHDLLAGIFAVAAFVAIVFEIVFGGFTKESIVGGIKDISGVFIDVLVLFIAASAFIKRRQKNIATILEEDIEKWGDNNLPLLFKVEGFKQAQNTNYTQGFALLQNPKDYIEVLDKKLYPQHPEWSKYASYSSGLTGKFIDMPSYQLMTKEKFQICIVMTQSHFKNMEKFDEIFAGIIRSVKSKYEDVIDVSQNGKEFKFTMLFKQEIKTREDINMLIEILDHVVSLVKVVA